MNWLPFRQLAAAVLFGSLGASVHGQPSIPSALEHDSSGIGQYVAFRADRVAITGALVIDGTGRPAKPEHTVLIENGRIVWVGPDSDARAGGYRRIDGSGRTLIPGIVGMHDHTHRPRQTFTGWSSARLWLGSGVTTVQTAGAAEADREIALAADIAQGLEPGPTVVPSAPYVTGTGGSDAMTRFADPDAARGFVADWVERGVRWFKLYRHVEPEIAAAVIDEAHRRGARVTGHLCSLSFAEAAEMGIDRIEHGLNAAADFVAGRTNGECRSNRAALDALDLSDPRIDDLIELLVRSGVVLTSTLPIIESNYGDRPQADARSLRALSPALRREYRNRLAQLDRGTAASRSKLERLAKIMDFEMRFVRAGGLLVAGPDPGRNVLPGFGNQRAGELLHEAGLPTEGVVQVLSANGAEALGMQDRFGRIVLGLQADLVLLDGNLLDEISVLRRPHIVFSDGVAFDPDSLIAAAAGQVGIR